MPETVVSFRVAELNRQFQDQLDPTDLGPLETAVMATLNNQPNNMGVTQVTASVEADGKVVKFKIQPPGLGPNAIKAALR